MKKLSKKTLRILISFGIGVLLVLADYIIINCGYPIVDDLDTLGITEFYVHAANRNCPFNADEVVLIDVGYDKSLAYVVDDGDTIGQLDVTNRQELIHLLKIAHNSGYKYLFMDVRFPKQLVTNEDRELFALMRDMPHFCISTHSDIEIADKGLQKVAAFADYGITLTTGFSRYEMLQNSGESVALAMYRDLDGGDIHHHWFYYTDNYRPCYNNVFIPISSELVSSFEHDGFNKYMRLGSQLFAYDSDQEISDLLRNKYVIVGDFDNDLHTTYAGDIPGAMLSFLAYLSVHNHLHLVNPWLWLLQCLIYAAISYKVMATAPFSKKLREVKWKKSPRLTKWLNRIGAIKAPVLRFIILYLTWGLTLTILNILYYIAFSILITTFIPTLCFSILSHIKAARKS
jgi:hypothetical protein